MLDRTAFCPPGHGGMSGAICGCHSWRRESPRGVERVGPGMLLSSVQDTPTPVIQLRPVDSAEAERPYSKSSKEINALT